MCALIIIFVYENQYNFLKVIKLNNCYTLLSTCLSFPIMCLLLILMVDNSYGYIEFVLPQWLCNIFRVFYLNVNVLCDNMQII